MNSRGEIKNWGELTEFVVNLLGPSGEKIIAVGLLEVTAAWFNKLR